MSTQTAEIPYPSPDSDASHPVTRSASWTSAPDDQTGRQKHTVLFRKASATRWVVQHIRIVTIRQRGETTSSLDPDVSLSDIPMWAIDEAGLEYDGGVLRG